MKDSDHNDHTSVTPSPAMVTFIPSSQRRLALSAAQSDQAPVLISGASGTGKGAIARWIHANGPRAGKVFEEAKHDESLSSQILRAQGGTLVVQDIGEWSLSEQKMLLDFLKTRSIPHLDNNGTRMLVNTRIIATTGQNLESRASTGLFNAELLSSINVFRLEMPPLHKRGEELEDIATGILREICREVHKDHIRGFSKDAWAKIQAYRWPGNIRELRNVLRSAVLLAAGDWIERSDLPQVLESEAMISAGIDFRATRDVFERMTLLEILRTCKWDLDIAARTARMDRATLITKINRYELFKEKYSET